jgi:uncharacterized protein YodC (DUF2158 family)
MNHNIGDVVRLKSGGPKMTIDTVNYAGHSGLVRCVWFSENEVRYDNFSKESLELVVPEKIHVIPYRGNSYGGHPVGCNMIFPDYDDRNDLL